MDNFEIASRKERLAFETLLENYNLFKNNYRVNGTPVDSNDIYDYWIHKFNENFSITQRIIVEIKIRNLSGSQLEDARENGWILETKKFNSLKKASEIDPEMKILYVCFTPDGTLFFDLKDLEEKKLLKVTKKVMNKATMNSIYEKENKSCYLLKSEWAVKTYPFIWDDRIYENKQREILAIAREEKINNIVKEDINILGKLLFGLK